MSIQVIYPDETDFQMADERRLASTEVEFGGVWRWPDSTEPWRLVWLRETGELYLARNDASLGNASPDVQVLAVIHDEDSLDEALEGWESAMQEPGSLAWLCNRLYATGGALPV